MLPNDDGRYLNGVCPYFLPFHGAGGDVVNQALHFGGVHRGAHVLREGFLGQRPGSEHGWGVFYMQLR